MSRSFWSAPREWPGQTVYIIAGGPSVLGQDIDVLRGQRVIVINSSVYLVPWADYLYFGDWRWYNEPANKAAVTRFAGRVVTVSQLVDDKKVLVCRKLNPPAFAALPDALMQKWTSLTAATNFAAHLIGPGGTIIWLGADGKHAPDGRSHHHKPHRWRSDPKCYERHRADLAAMVQPLASLNIALFNASPGSAWADLFPIINLQDMHERRVA